MGSPYYNFNPFENYDDPLGYNDYLEEQRRKKEEEEKSFLNYISGIVKEASRPTPSLLEALTGAVSLPFEFGKAPVNYLASRDLEDVRPAGQLLRSAIAPEVLPGDIEENVYETIMTPSGPISRPRTTTPEDIKQAQIASGVVGKGIETAGEFGLDPLNWLMGAPGATGKVVAGMFIPGMAESMGTEAGLGISALESGDPVKAAEHLTGAGISGLFTGLASKHLASGKPATSESRLSEEVVEPSPSRVAPILDESMASPRTQQAPKDVRDFLYETNETYRDLADQLSAFERDREGWGGLPPGFEKTLKTQEIRVKQEMTDIENSVLSQSGESLNAPKKITVPGKAIASDIVNLTNLDRAKEITESYLETLKPEAAKALNDEAILDTKIAYEGGSNTMRFDRERNTIFLDPELLLRNSPRRLASDIMHELGHKPESASHQTATSGHGLGMRIVDRPEYGEKVGELPLGETPADFVIDAGELGLKPEQLEKYSEYPVAEIPAELGVHLEENIPLRASAGGQLESSFQTAFDAIRNAERNANLGEAYRNAIFGIQRQAHQDYAAARGLKVARTPEEYLADIRAGVNIDEATAAPKATSEMTNAELLAEADKLEATKPELASSLRRIVERRGGKDIEPVAEFTSEVDPTKAEHELEVLRKKLVGYERRGWTKKAEDLKQEIADKELSLGKKTETVSEKVEEVTPVETKPEVKVEEPAQVVETTPTGKQELDLEGIDEIWAKYKQGKETPKVEVPKEEVVTPEITKPVVEAKPEIKTEVKPEVKTEAKTEPVSETAPPSEKVVSEPANILRKILTATKLTKFNKNTVIKDLEAKGVPVPEEVKTQLPALLEELKSRGWINEKIGGTYTLLVEPPKRLQEWFRNRQEIERKAALPGDLEGALKASLEVAKETKNRTPEEKAIADKVKAKLTIQEIDEVSRILNVGKKGKKELPEALRLAREAAEKALGAPRPPKPKAEPKIEGGLPSEEILEATEVKPTPFEVTLSDGSTHTVRAADAAEAKSKAEEVLKEYNSTKVVDKVVPKLSSLERAAKYEIEPVQQGMEEVADTSRELGVTTKQAERAQERELKDQLKVTEGLKKSEERTETKEFAKRVAETERLRKAQAREKFATLSYVVKLSNGKKLNVKARSAEAAQKIVRDHLQARGSNVTIDGIFLKPTPIKSAIEKALEEPAKRDKADKFTKGIVDDVTDIPKTLKSAFDISWPGRQGLFLLNRKVARAGMIEGSKSVIPVWGREHHERVMNDLKSRPNAELYDAAGLNQVRWDPDVDISARSEQFASEKASQLPGLRHSERAFNDAGNLARANMFDEYVNIFTKQGKTFETHPELYKGMAEYLNVLTMRKPLPEKLRQAGWIMNKMFFSPMAVYSRLEMINPMWYAKLPKEMRTAAIRDIGGTLGTITAMLAAVKYAGAQAGLSDDELDVSFDPAHTHFLRLKVKETYYDLPGITPMVRTLYRMVSGRKKTEKGEYQLPGGLLTRYQEGLEKAPFGSSAFDELGGFIENKTSPPYHVLKGALKSKGWYGKDYGLADALSDLFMPMSPEQTIEAGIEYGPDAAARQFPNFFGIGTHFSPKQDETKRSKKSKRRKNPLYSR